MHKHTHTHTASQHTIDNTIFGLIMFWKLQLFIVCFKMLEMNLVFPFFCGMEWLKDCNICFMNENRMTVWKNLHI